MLVEHPLQVVVGLPRRVGLDPVLPVRLDLLDVRPSVLVGLPESLHLLDRLDEPVLQSLLSIELRGRPVSLRFQGAKGRLDLLDPPVGALVRRPLAIGRADAPIAGHLRERLDRLPELLLRLLAADAADASHEASGRLAHLRGGQDRLLDHERRGEELLVGEIPERLVQESAIGLPARSARPRIRLAIEDEPLASLLGVDLVDDRAMRDHLPPDPDDPPADLDVQAAPADLGPAPRAVAADSRSRGIGLARQAEEDGLEPRDHRALALFVRTAEDAEALGKVKARRSLPDSEAGQLEAAPTNGLLHSAPRPSARRPSSAARVHSRASSGGPAARFSRILPDEDPLERSLRGERFPVAEIDPRLVGNDLEAMKPRRQAPADLVDRNRERGPPAQDHLHDRVRGRLRGERCDFPLQVRAVRDARKVDHRPSDLARSDPEAAGVDRLDGRSGSTQVDEAQKPRSWIVEPLPLDGTGIVGDARSSAVLAALVDVAEREVIEAPSREMIEIEDEGARPLGDLAADPVDRAVEEADALDVRVTRRSERVFPVLRRRVLPLMEEAGGDIHPEAVEVEGRDVLRLDRRDEGPGPGRAVAAEHPVRVGPFVVIARHRDDGDPGIGDAPKRPHGLLDEGFVGIVGFEQVARDQDGPDIRPIGSQEPGRDPVEDEIGLSGPLPGGVAEIVVSEPEMEVREMKDSAAHATSAQRAAAGTA